MHLTNRTVVLVTGSDAAEFMQGLVTQDISTPRLEQLALFDESAGEQQTTTTDSARWRRQMFTTAFLNVRGRLRNDAFLFRYLKSPRDSPVPLTARFWIDVDTAGVAEFVRYLRRLKMRARVMVEPLDPQELATFALWERPVEDIWRNPASPTWRPAARNFPDESLGLRECFADPRAPGLGWRVLGNPEEVLSNSDQKLPGARETLGAWRLRRYMCGVAEGDDEIFFDSAFPTECSYDFFGGLDLRKECFVGHEVVSRRRYHNIVGRRIVPVQIYEHARRPPIRASHARPVYDPSVPFPPPTTGSSVIRNGVTGRGQSGKFIQCVGNIGLAKCDLDMMTGAMEVGGGDAARPDQSAYYQIKDSLQGRGLCVRPFMVPWLRNHLEAVKPKKKRRS